MSSEQHLRNALRGSMVQTELEHRLRAATAMLVCLLIFFVQGMPALMLLSGTQESLTWRVASVTRAGPEVVGLIFLALSTLLIPLLAAQFHGGRARRARKLAVFSLCGSSLVWMLLSYQATPLDYGMTHVLFALYSASALMVALSLAWFLNAEQLRLLTEHA